MAGGLPQLVSGHGSCLNVAYEGDWVWSAGYDRKLLSYDAHAAIAVHAPTTACRNDALYAFAAVANDDVGGVCWTQREARHVTAVWQLEKYWR